MIDCDKLPATVLLSDYNGDWESFKEAIYRIFRTDFIDNRVKYNGKNVDIIHQTIFDGKERSFWHVISTGKDDNNRIPEIPRCERVGWVKALIEDNDPCAEYKSWKKYHDKNNKDRYYIWCAANNYMVILEDRDTHYKLITAFVVKEYNIDYYESEYQQYKSI